MKSATLQYLLSAVVAVPARGSIFSSNTAFSGASFLDSSLQNPICSRISNVPGIGLENHTPSKTFGAASKVEQIASPALNHIGGEAQWSHISRCLREQNMTEKFCVYTNQDFARNRGISFWTTPEHAEEILKLPAFSDPDILRGVNEEPNPPYESRQLPGRGMGLIANRTLQKGDLIFSTTPVLMVEERIWDIFAKHDMFPYLHRAVRKLPRRSEKKFMDLWGHFGGDPIEDIINTNSFAIDMWDDKEETAYNAVFPEISRLNHDCRPNAHYYFDTESLTQHVHALRTILPGEELTISYIDPALVRSERQEKLELSWGFQCSCSLCTQPEPHTQVSDLRIKRIVALSAELEDYTSESEATTSMAELLISLYEQERLHGPIAEAYALAAIEFNGVGEAWTAEKYAQLAVQTGLLYGGPTDPDVRVMVELLDDPWSHWSWMLRTEKRLEAKGKSS
ncbi:hypothetical protein FKW77_008461 [Venturia effusa]|uniref:SET domain-containing protein n=1 Tax=Venturia effusa TaxID=50376 RepID=A0A517L7V3_9PEZI|nr:hypothetical protein FKW77_008461 [Venturia effusa]